MGKQPNMVNLLKDINAVRFGFLLSFSYFLKILGGKQLVRAHGRSVLIRVSLFFFLPLSLSLSFLFFLVSP